MIGKVAMEVGLGGLESNARLLSALEDIGVLGEWSFDYARQVFRSSPGISHAFNVDPESGERGQPVEVYERAVHLDDIRWLRETRATVPGASGLRVTEVRVIDADGHERWIMIRGRFVVGEDERPTLGYGVMLDITKYTISGDHPLIAPSAPISQPRVVLLDALSTAFRAARQIGLDAIEKACRILLMQSARHVARETSNALPSDRDRRRLH